MTRTGSSSRTTSRAYSRPGYEPGPYSAVQEGGVIQFVDWYADTLARSITGHQLVAAE